MAAGTGFQLNFWRHMGMLIDACYDYAPVIDNLTGDKRNSGGFSLALGVRIRIWG